MVVSELLLLSMSIYLLYRGIGFFLEKPSIKNSIIYHIIITNRVKSNTLYRKAIGLDFIFMGAFGLTIIELFHLCSGFTEFDYTLVKIFLVIELLITICLKMIYLNTPKHKE